MKHACSVLHFYLKNFTHFVFFKFLFVYFFKISFYNFLSLLFSYSLSPSTLPQYTPPLFLSRKGRPLVGIVKAWYINPVMFGSFQGLCTIHALCSGRAIVSFFWYGSESGHIISWPQSPWHPYLPHPIGRTECKTAWLSWHSNAAMGSPIQP